MQIGDLDMLFGEHPELGLINRELAKGKEVHLLLSGLHAGARALALAHVKAPLFVILDNAEAAQYLYSDLQSLSADAVGPAAPVGPKVYFFPAAQKRRTVDDAAMIQRTECLSALRNACTQTPVIVTYPEAIAEEVPRQEELDAVSIQYSVGQEIPHSAISEQLSAAGFVRVDFVFQPGQYAIRGSIVDI